MVVICILLIIFLKGVSTQDECRNCETLPNAGQRYYNYRVNDVIVHDFYLKPAWYRAGDEIMPTEKPTSLYICGTQFPVWLNGTHPTAQHGIVHRVACAASAQSFCSIEYDIKVKNCGTFFVYFLTNTASRQEAYCFGDLPTFVPPKPVVSAIEVVKQGDLDMYSRVHFVCKFQTSTNSSEAGLYYQVFWYATKDGSEVMHVMDEQPRDNLDDLELTEEIFMNDMKQSLGVEISCAVLPLSGKQGIPGTLSERSNPFFAGIHVNVIRSKITRGDNGNPGNVSVTSTIPIGCEGRRGCSLAIVAYVQDKDKCNGPSFGDYCGTEIFSNRSNSSYYINIVAGNDAAYALSGIFDIYLKTESSIPRIWDNYYLPKVSVEIADSPLDYWKGKTCWSQNDPHMKTFDGRSFENHKAGEYILYRHLSFTAEVQIKTIPCGGPWSSSVRCNCGVAVKAGFDVFVFDVCGTLPFIGYKDGLCVDSTLDVLKTGNTYKVFFPYGTYVDVSFWSTDPRFLSVYVTSSIHDDNMKSTGLCGAISGICTDDFRNRNGTSIQNVNGNCDTAGNLQPIAVLDEWRVWNNESLFAMTKDVKDNLVPWTTYVCACNNNSGSTVDTNIPCGGHTTQACHLGAKVGTKTCHILHQRKRRSVPNIDRFPSPQHRARRSALNQLSEPINMTEEEAQNYCRNYMKESPIFDLCTKVPSTRSEENINTCVLDILLTKTTVWSDSARESLREQCLNEISRNNTFREAEETSRIVSEIEEKACPSMCTNKGLCVNELKWFTICERIGFQKAVFVYKCLHGAVPEYLQDLFRPYYSHYKLRSASHGNLLSPKPRTEQCKKKLQYSGTCICDSGYGSSDCSLDLSEPPEIFGLLDDGLCDESHVECNQAFVYGEIFAEGENLTCRIKTFIMSVDGIRKYEATFYVPADHETLFEVVCPVQQTRRKKRSLGTNTEAPDRFVIGYTISVSNDGQRYGRDFDLYMYNSECQLSQNGSERLTFSLMDGYCFIDHKCVGNGQVHNKDECLICDDKQLKFDWSARDNHHACRNEPDTSPPRGSSQSIAINFSLILLSALISGMKIK